MPTVIAACHYHNISVLTQAKAHTAHSAAVLTFFRFLPLAQGLHALLSFILSSRHEFFLSGVIDSWDATDVLFGKWTPGRWLSDQRQHTVRAPAEPRPQRLTFCTLQQLHSGWGWVFVYNSDYCWCLWPWIQRERRRDGERGGERVNRPWGLRFLCFRLVDLQYSGL